jgi:ABC-type transport system involved in cytochrome c biogenesis permease subunit
MDKKTGLYAFMLLAVLVLVMAWATYDGYIHGSIAYNSVWFSLLWILMATVGSYFISVGSLYKRLPVFLLHVAFLVILSGALTTRLTGRTGQIHLRENQPASSFFDEWTHNRVVFPFSLSLKSFVVEYYPGTTSPANYQSIVELTDIKTGERLEYQISMNKILRYSGYRFYQSSFDEDWQGSILSVNHDTWGILLSYTGYFLMFFSMLWVLFDKRERFRFLLRKLAKKTALIVLLLCLTTNLLGFQNPVGLKPELAHLGRLWVDDHGRICPIQTLANNFTVKLTGKTSYQHITGEQFFFGWLFFPEQWMQEPLFKLKTEELKRIANSKTGYASFTDFLDSEGTNKLEPYYRQMYGSNKPEGWLKEAVNLNDKFQLIEMLQNGSLLKIFPMNDVDGKIQWFAPNMDIPVQTDSMENMFARHFFSLYYEALMQGDADKADMYVDKLLSLQQKKAGNLLPSAIQLKMELFYNRVQIFSLLFKICFTLGLLCLFVFLFKDSKIQILNLIQDKDSNPEFNSGQRFHQFLYFALWIVFVAATAGLGMRACIGGRLPLSNGYETMLLLAWISLLTGILARRYSFMIVAFSFLLAGFTLLVAHIGSMNPQITPLVPVLQSPLLSLHVLIIMVSYGLCGFMALNSLTAIIVWLTDSKKIDRTAFVLRMKEISELLMYPATFLLGAGIFIGAIWANISWGRYWGWDPKEVWALITFLLMGFTFHEKTLTWFRKPLFYHAFALIIFLAVLITYFGVNYLLGGRHSYA